MSKSFKTRIKKFDGNLWQYYILIPSAKAVPFLKKTGNRVWCSINQTHTMQAALLPLKGGDYFINLNKTVRSKLNLSEGDMVSVVLEVDQTTYGLPVTDEMTELLEQDQEGSELFHALTPGKQRTLLYIASQVKHPDLRLKRAIAIMEHLKATEGKVDYKKLNLLIRQ